MNWFIDMIWITLDLWWSYEKKTESLYRWNNATARTNKHLIVHMIYDDVILSSFNVNNRFLFSFENNTMEITHTRLLKQFANRIKDTRSPRPTQQQFFYSCLNPWNPECVLENNWSGACSECCNFHILPISGQNIYLKVIQRSLSWCGLSEKHS